jgi:hypothetical protein
MKNSTPIAAEPTTVYNLPPSMRPVPSQAVESFRAAHPAPIPSSIAAALCAAEAFIDAAQARPIGEYDEWPAQLYKNALAMISFAE